MNNPSVSLDELDAIMSLQRQEAFDDSAHQSGPRGGASRKQPLHEAITAEEELLQLLKEKDPPRSRSRSTQRKSSSRKLQSPEEGESGRRKPSARARSTSRMRKQSSARVLHQTDDGQGNSNVVPRSNSLGSAESIARRDFLVKRTSRRSMSSASPAVRSRSKSVLRRLKKDTSTADDSTKMAKSNPQSNGNVSDENNGRQRTPRGSSFRRSSSSRRVHDGTSDDRDAMRTNRSPSGSYEDSKDDREQKRRPRLENSQKGRSQRKINGDNLKSFLHDKPDGAAGNLYENASATSDVASQKSYSGRSHSGKHNSSKGRGERKGSEKDSTGSDEKSGMKRKTKMEKIIELQAKYDKYKEEFIETSKEKRVLKKELEQTKLQVVEITKELDTSFRETKILRENLSGALERAETLAEEQRKERIEYSNIAKDLAEARIDHTKTIDESRKLKNELDTSQRQVEDKDRQIKSLTETVENHLDRIFDLEGKFDRADDEIKQLDDELRHMEEELAIYKRASVEDNSDSQNAVRREALDAMEKKRMEELEARLNKQKEKLDQNALERVNFKAQITDKEKRLKELEEQLREEQERKRLESAIPDKTHVDDQFNVRILELEEEIAALRAKLKSEQLMSSDKLKNKDASIEEMRNELAQAKEAIEKRDIDPDSQASLKTHIKELEIQVKAAARDLEDKVKHSSTLQKQLEEAGGVATQLTDEAKSLKQRLLESSKQVEEWKRKSEDFKKKASEWTDKAYEWKQKAEAKADNDSKESDSGPVEDPQALFLQAAMQRKKTVDSTAGAGGWGIKSMFAKKAGVDIDDASGRIQELEEENATQAQTIKKLQSDLVMQQAKFKEDIYNVQKQVLQANAEKEAVEGRNAALQKELELARKLQKFAESSDP